MRVLNRGIVGQLATIALTIAVSGISLAQSPAQLRTLLRDQPHSTLTQQFYESRAYVPAWTTNLHLTADAREVIRVLRQTDTDGLPVADYELARIEELARDAERDRYPAALAELELLLTASILKYASHLLAGLIDPRAIHSGWALQSRRANVIQLLGDALAGHRISELPQRLRSPDPQYALLRSARARYKELERQGGWNSVPAGPTMHPGDTSPRVRDLRRRLHVTERNAGALPDSGAFFDGALEATVRVFQRRHGLVEDGVVGVQTLNALNVPVSTRLHQIDLNLERIRWMPDDLGARYLLINIAGFELALYDQGRRVLESRVIVGKPHTRTPVFSTQLTEVVLAPYWNVPRSIERNEILPRVRRDPSYLERHDMVRLPNGTLRQDPGPSNPLGRVKFTIPNPYSVGLHDTPERHLFANAVCAFSHGCMRVEKPVDLAAFLLRDNPAWTRQRIEETIQRWRETRVAVATPVPLYVLYVTVWVDEQGDVQFRDDLYGHDASMQRLLTDTALSTATPPSSAHLHFKGAALPYSNSR